MEWHFGISKRKRMNGYLECTLQNYLFANISNRGNSGFSGLGIKASPSQHYFSKETCTKDITYPCTFHAFFSLEGMKNGLKSINAYQSQGPNFRQCWYGSYGTINIAANCTKNWSWTRKILYEETVAHAKKHEICCCQTD